MLLGCGWWRCVLGNAIRMAASRSCSVADGGAVSQGMR